MLGPSGSGKTTLLRAILGLEPLSEGTITALGEPVRRRGNRRIGYLPQARPLPRDTSIRGRELVGLGPVKERIREMAALLVIDKLRREAGLESSRSTSR